MLRCQIAHTEIRGGTVERPRLKAHYQATVVDGTKVFLVSDGEHYLVQGRAAVAVLPYLDGRHTVFDIVGALGASMPPTEIFLALRKYEISGHFAEGRPDLPDHELAYWDALGVAPAVAIDRLASSVLTVVAVGAVVAEPVLAALCEAGLRVQLADPQDECAAPAERDGLTVVLVDDYLDPELAALNTAYLSAGRRWIVVRPSGMVLWAGPLFDPERTGCWACLHHRVSANRQVERYLRSKQPDAARGRVGASPRSSSGPALLGALLAGELAKWMVGVVPSKLDGAMITLDTRSLETAEHTLIRQPQCHACGDPTLITARSPKIELGGADPARHTTDGGYRVVSPAETFERLKKHISPILGAVTSLKMFTGTGNEVAHSYSAGHNFAMAGDSLALLKRNLRGQSGGKGRTDIQAKVGAVCEAIERFSGVWLGDEPVTRQAYRDLGPDVAVHPSELLHFSPAQVEVRKSWNADPSHRLHLVPDPLPDDAVIDWTSAWSLTHDRERLVPSAYAWFGHPDLNERFYCAGDSNGNAAGNTVEEAIIQGFCELVERDAVAIWWYNRLQHPEFDLDSLNDPYVETVRRFYADMGRSLWVLDLTTDLGVPVCAAISHRIGHPAEDILIGFGAHLDPRIAAVRALTEVNQFLPAVEQRAADGTTNYLEDDVATLAWWREAKVAEETWLTPNPDLPATTVTTYPTIAGDDLAENVRTCVRLAEDAGLDVIALDQSRPDLELKVVKVMVPGLRHFWRRLGAGRLYDAPVRMGRLATALTEQELNPRNVYF
jgi:bacteriocin biosynthesis cyclodehydratase domain-containing protein